MKRGAYKLFVPGPVQMYPDILELGGRQPPYFRTEEFSNEIIKCSKQIKDLIDAPEDSEVVFLTSSATGAMEAALINLFTADDELLIVNGGGFGQRFCDICATHRIPFTQVRLSFGEGLTREHLEPFEGKGYRGMLINGHETTTGILYDLEMVGEFCKRNNMILVVDAVSTFLADYYSMSKWNIDVSIFSSQKALSLPPGLSFLVLSPAAADIIRSRGVNSYYFGLKNYLSDARRGQTPFTPAVITILQLSAMLDKIENIGIENFVGRTETLARDFRKKAASLPFKIPAGRLSNAVTPLLTAGKTGAYDIFLYLKNHYGIYVCPSGGELSNTLLRVAHIGNLTTEDNDMLVEAFWDMERRGIL